MNKRISRALTFKEMHEAALKGEKGSLKLEQVIQTLLEYKERGESVSYRFNGFKLESDEISIDDIERTYEEYRKALSSKLPRELFAEEMRDVALKGQSGNLKLEQAVQAMLEYKAKGESVYYVFNGFELNSDEITTVEETIEKYDRFLRRDREPKTKDEKITTQKIGKATINTPTTAKKEAEQVENGENTRDNIKEGEEVGDDN